MGHCGGLDEDEALVSHLGLQTEDDGAMAALGKIDREVMADGVVGKSLACLGQQIRLGLMELCLSIEDEQLRPVSGGVAYMDHPMFLFGGVLHLGHPPVSARHDSDCGLITMRLVGCSLLRRYVRS